MPHGQSVLPPCSSACPIPRRLEATYLSPETRRGSPQAEAAEEDGLGEGDDQEDGADDGVEAEEGEVDPVESAAAGNPMFQHEAADNDQPANQVGDAEFAEQPESEQESAH